MERNNYDFILFGMIEQTVTTFGAPEDIPVLFKNFYKVFSGIIH